MMPARSEGISVLFISISSYPYQIPSDKQFVNDLLSHMPKDITPTLWTMNEGVPVSTKISNITRDIPFISVNRLGHRPRIKGNKEYRIHRNSRFRNIVEVAATILVQSLGGLREIIRENNTQVLHFTDDIGPAIRILRQRFPRLIITCAKPSVDRVVGFRRMFYKRRLKTGLNAADRVFAFSEKCRQYLLNYGIRSRVDVIPWGIVWPKSVSLDRIREIRREVGCPPNGVLVLVSPRNLKDNFLAAMRVAETASRKSRLLFVFCIKPSLWKAGYDRQSSERIRVIPSPPHFYEILASADALFAPQGFTPRTSLPPLLWLESMSRGTPVVTENNLGVLETIENCVSGLLFENIGSAVEVLDKLNNADLLNRMKRYAVQTVSTKFCIDNIARKYADVWVELISNKKPTR